MYIYFSDSDAFPTPSLPKKKLVSHIFFSFDSYPIFYLIHKIFIENILGYRIKQ